MVPLEVLCLGISRTGTTSLGEALSQLGYADVYHGEHALHENPQGCDMWLDAYRALREGKGSFDREEWDQLLGHCMAVSDVPCATFGPELISAYPEAKVILTVRDSAEAWCKSMESTLWPLGKQLWGSKGWIDPFYRWLTGQRTKLFQMNRRLMWLEPQLADFDKKRGKIYEEHNARIRALVPSERLLVYNLKEGWVPLCGFLGKEVPPTPFPRSNDSGEFGRRAAIVSKKLRMRALRKLAMLLAGTGLLAAVLALVVPYLAKYRWARR